MRDQMHRTANRENEDVKTDATEESSEAESKFAGGKPPAVTKTFNEQHGTAQLAYEEDANERELKTKVAALVTSKFGGDYQKAFAHYDKDKDGGVTKSEIVQLLSDAGVGNGLTRGIWATTIIEKLDGNADRAIQWAEFESVFRTTA